MGKDSYPDSVILLWPQGAPGTGHWQQKEKFSRTPPESPVQFRFVRNVTQPTLTAFLPKPEEATGAAVVVCPGGAMHVLAIDHEGYEVAQCLQQKGIAAFVLKYRVLPTPEDNIESEAYMQKILADSEAMRQLTESSRPHALADGQRAVSLIRERAQQWNIDPECIGIMGFSAGGFVAASVALHHDAASRPSFVALIYAALWEKVVPPKNPPPLFLALANDDGFGQLMFDSSQRLFDSWRGGGHSVELHAYAKGGHGFGMLKQGLPSDGWIERFYEWLKTENLV